MVLIFQFFCLGHCIGQLNKVSISKLMLYADNRCWVRENDMQECYSVWVLMCACLCDKPCRSRHERLGQRPPFSVVFFLCFEPDGLALQSRDQNGQYSSTGDERSKFHIIFAMAHLWWIFLWQQCNKRKMKVEKVQFKQSNNVVPFHLHVSYLVLLPVVPLHLVFLQFLPGLHILVIVTLKTNLFFYTYSTHFTAFILYICYCQYMRSVPVNMTWDQQQFIISKSNKSIRFQAF